MKRFLKPLLIILAILLLTLSVSAGDLFSTYGQRIKLTIDHTKIDADLSWFPVTVFLTSSQGEEVFTEFDADEDFDRVAFTTSDEETQLYADCELFDDSESKAIYHVSKTGWTVSSSTDTDFYMYYDNDAGHNTTYISKSSVIEWVSPTGHNDPSSVWGDDAKAYDDNTGTFTGYSIPKSSWSGYLELTFDSMDADKVRIYHQTSNDIDNMEIDYYDTDWVNFYSDEVGAINQWVDYSIGSTKTITKIRIRYENTSASFNRYIYLKEVDIHTAGASSAHQSVWDSNFKSVYHMADYNTSTILDATSNLNHGTKKGSGEPAEATGKVGQGQDFDGSNDYIDIGDMALTGSFTVEAVANYDNVYRRCILAQIDNGENYFPVLGTQSYNQGMMWIKSTAGGQQVAQENDAVSTGTWYHTAGVSNGTTIYYYLDGAVGDITDDYIAPPALTNTMQIGSWRGILYGATYGWFDGIIDEVRISSTDRSAAWIAATYDSLWDTLLTYGSEETGGTGEATNVLFIFSNF